MKKQVLDMTCGARSCWLQPGYELADFCDQRAESQTLCDGRTIQIKPDIIADFRHLPFSDESYNLVLFDPPHLKHAGPNSWLRAKYGVLDPDTWENDIRAGLNEAWRVLKKGGTLIFKWSDEQIPTYKVVPLFPQKPLFGHRRGKTIFVVAYKPEDGKEAHE